MRVFSSASNDETNAGVLPKPVCWSEGMLLSPHHFQQNHQYLEKQISRIIKLLTPNYWGVGKMELDHSALSNGTINIKRLFAILPDGLLIDYDYKHDGPLQLDMSELGDHPVAVQLTVPIQVPGSASSKSEIQRYSSEESRPEKDENTGDN